MKIFKIIISFLLVYCILGADEEFLSQNKKDILRYSYEKSIEDSIKLKNDWINPITYKYIYNDGENYDTTKSFISISQPIFKSGGIYYAIKYASSVKDFTTTNIDTQKKELIKQIVNLLFQIKKINISIQKQALLVQNANLDVTRKKEQVLNGILDTSFLDNAILDANNKKNTLIDFEYQKEELINNLSNLSDKKYKQMELPTFSITDDENYLKNNIYIKKASQDIDQSYWLKNTITSNYFPTINFTYDYTKYHDRDNNPALKEDGTTNVGFNITIPLDIKSPNNIASYKIAYLQKKAQLEDKKKQESSIFKSAMAKIKSLDKKIDISKKDVELYDSLVIQLQEQLQVGMKVISDVQMMENSKKIKALDVKSLEIDKQIELLEIYSRIEIKNG